MFCFVRLQLLDTDDELYRFFVSQVRRNLHVVFTMNPASPDFHNRSATSPALFNRKLSLSKLYFFVFVERIPKLTDGKSKIVGCVIDWFGDWTDKAFQQVASEFTRNVDLDDAAYEPPAVFPVEPLLLQMPARVSHRDAIITSLVFVHSTITTGTTLLSFFVSWRKMKSFAFFFLCGQMHIPKNANAKMQLICSKCAFAAHSRSHQLRYTASLSRFHCSICQTAGGEALSSRRGAVAYQRWLEEAD